MSTIKPGNESIRTILNDIDKGKWVIPNFQRDFTWTTTQVKELLESILQSYYIGAILVWKCRDGDSAKLSVEPVYGTDVSQDDLQTESIILDGQQRLTSLYYAKYAPDRPLKWTRYPYAFFIDIQKIIDGDYDDCVVPESRQNAGCKKLLQDRTEQFRKFLFPVCELESMNTWMDDFQEFLEEEKKVSREESRKIKARIRDHLEVLEKDYQIAVIELPQNMALDHVCEIFERINSKGTTLTVFDLLNARLLKDGIELRNLWLKDRGTTRLIHDFSRDNPKFPVLLLQTLSLLRKSYCRRREIIELSADGFAEDWATSIQFTNQALKAITNYRKDSLSFGVLNKNYLPYQPMIPILAALLKTIDKDDDVPSCTAKIVRWYWSSVFTRAYSGSTDSQIAKDFRQMKAWFSDSHFIPDVVHEAQTALSLGLEQETRVSGAVYRGIMSLIMLKGAKDFYTGKPPEYHRLNDHHIFPRNQMKGLPMPLSAHVESIVNRTLISVDSNLKDKMKKMPSVYLSQIESQIGREALIANLKSHFIDEQCYECMLQDDFSGFLERRKDLLTREVERVVT